MRILITGSEGYLGRLLAPSLMASGHDVVGVDTGFYKSGWLYHDHAATPTTLDRDVRTLTSADLEGFDAVVHMAELSNDPLGDLISEVTFEINHEASVRLAEIARAAGAQRFIYMSSCSVYGVADGEADETSPTNPQTAYAVCKERVERDVGALATDDFSPTFLRSATAFGASPRMRFDIVLNNLSGLAFTTGTIAMTSDGTPWRPLVHGLDIASAISSVIEAPRTDIHGQILNVGSNEQNYQVKEIAEIVADVFTGCQLSFGPIGSDTRSYRVRFDKINDVLPTFRCEWNAERGARQLRTIFERVQLDEATFSGRAHNRLKQIEHLLRTAQLDERLYWTD